MRRILLVLAPGILLLANTLALLHAWQNRAGGPPATFELTERELWLEERDEENSALFLQLEWGGAGRRIGHRYEDGPGWFDAAKLRELGYPIGPDPLDEASASKITALPTIEAFATLGYGLEEKLQSSTSAVYSSRLTAVDVDRKASALRAKYPDAGRYLILQCLVRPWVERRYDEVTRIFKAGYVRGAIVGLTGSSIYVPPAQRRLLAQLGRKSSRQYFSSSQAARLAPRYTATIAIGSRLEPWLCSVRLLESR